jgi:phospholipase/carboxylesterase
MLAHTPGSPALPLPYTLRQPQVHIRRPPLLVALHGMSSNDQEFLRLLEGMDDRFLILALRGPFPQTAGNSAWFSVNWSAPSPQANLAHVDFGKTTLVNSLKMAIETFKVDPTQVYLFGHSQGAVMTLTVLLTHPDLITGAVAISGQILPELRSQIAAPERLNTKSLLIIHGLEDTVNPITFGRSTSALLNTLPLNVQYREFHMGHNLSPEALAHASDWLTDQLDHFGILGLPEAPNYKPRLSAIYLNVRNLERSIKFYIRFLGMELTERVGKVYAFLSSDKAHHTICLINAGPDAPDQIYDAVGLQQFTFEVPDQPTLARVLRTLIEGNVEVTLVDHLIAWGIRFQDPDQNHIEVIWDNRDLPGRANLWQGRDLPLNADKILSALDQEL